MTGKTGLTSLPVVMGVEVAARFACITMASMQIVVIALLALWGYGLSALIRNRCAGRADCRHAAADRRSGQICAVV